MIQPLTDEKPYTLTPGPDGLIETQTLEVSIGPQHPSTHGVFRMDCVLDGETVVALKPVMGYLHRNHEQLAERMAWLGSMPYTDRLDYFNSMTNNWAYALAVEKLAGIKVPERAEYIRVIVAELTRLAQSRVRDRVSCCRTWARGRRRCCTRSANARRFSISSRR